MNDATNSPDPAREPIRLEDRRSGPSDTLIVLLQRETERLIERRRELHGELKEIDRRLEHIEALLGDESGTPAGRATSDVA